MPRLSKIGAAALAAFGWTGLSSVSASYLVVAGGGGGGTNQTFDQGTGGGGAGGLLTGTTNLDPTLSYAVTVGASGAGSIANANNGTNGSNSVFNAITATGGGGGSSRNVAVGTPTSGNNGGSGGGGGGILGNLVLGGTGTVGQGNDGGTNGSGWGAGGGGGASAVGANGAASGRVGGNGGAGTASSISGSSVTYAGGGGGGGGNTTAGTGGSGGSGGGGAGGTFPNTNGANGTANLGGGGGGSSGCSTSTPAQVGGNGGSGVVIISYPSPQKFGGGIVTTSGANTIHTFQTSGTLSPLSTLSASYLIVAGGGAGGSQDGGGGGAGGMQTGSGVVIDTNSIYLVTVGAGGVGQTSTSITSGNLGSNSSFSAYATASVGGGGGGSLTGSPNNGTSGGSGGGASYGTGATGGSGTSGQGNAGGNNNGPAAGGGGGAGAVGSNGVSLSQGGAGGIGLTSSISGTSTYYAGGGGGAADLSSTTQALGGLGGGGNSAFNRSNNGTNGTANTGGGGGGGATGANVGYSGGSGVVIISYAGATQLMAGGTVTISGGNVIHTFTSSGYLAPLKLVNNSLRFRGSASAFLNRTFSTPTSRRIFTFSVWTKRGELVSNDFIFGRGTGPESYLQWSNNNTLEFYDYTGSSYSFRLVTTQVFLDPAAWYHIVVQVDTTQATSSNRIRIYVNGIQVTAFSTATYPSQNFDSNLNTNATVYIGRSEFASNYLDGYLTEVNFIDGQALTPNSFGTFNSYGVWQPITYGGSYGTNGFYLPFTNTASTTTLGYDFSPQGNNWTTNNISLTSGSTYDSMTDVPTLTSATTANYATFNPIFINGATYSLPSTVSNGNLYLYDTSSSNRLIASTISLPSTGKIYIETTWSQISSGNGFFGFSTNNMISVNGYYRSNGVISNTSGVSQTSGGTWSNNDVIAAAIDVDAGTVQFYKNNVAQGSTPSYTFTANTVLYPYVAFDNSAGTKECWGNFGQQPFVYTPPANYLALNTYNI